MTHELGHRMEDRNPEISIATKAFLKRRTAGLAAERYAKGEAVVGKDYATSPHHTELLSCGMEAITHGRFGGLTGRSTVFLPAPAGLAPQTAPNGPRPTPITWRSSWACWPRRTSAWPDHLFTSARPDLSPRHSDGGRGTHSSTVVHPRGE
jgi:hypothetical protein